MSDAHAVKGYTIRKDHSKNRLHTACYSQVWNILDFHWTTHCECSDTEPNGQVKNCEKKLT